MNAEVDISLEEISMGIRITFKDNGRGIDHTLVDKIFIPHFTTKQSGSGLGLAIAKQGIEQMGGKIWFETSGEGTSFFIELKSPH
jgi:signal transduction histidine kinase